MWEPFWHKHLSLSQQKNLPAHAGIRGALGLGKGLG